MHYRKTNYILFIIAFILIGCKDEIENQKDLTPGSNEHTNNWIHTNLSYYYLWSDELPTYSQSAIEPEDYFYSLLSNKDRFSWIQGDFRELLESLQGINLEAGYEFMLYGSNESENVIGQITYIKDQSPAASTLLQRGDIFSKINNQTITVNNYNALLSALSTSHSLDINRYNFNTDQLEELGKIDFSVAKIAENPILLDTTYQIDDQRIGYLVYNLFSTGVDDNETLYLNQMDQSFSRFKSEGINHLILDLRYNGGGAERATINLGSLIAGNVNSEDIFITRAYSKNYEADLIKTYGKEILNRYFESKPDNIGSLLAANKLIVLTSSRTASASELLINCLRPYMEVFIIGDVTVGKNVGSTTLYDLENPENNYGMQPIITKSFNTLGQSDYEQGFSPDILLVDNTIDKRALGDTRELLLNEAINHLLGLPSSIKYNNRLSASYKLVELYSSRELKANYGKQYTLLNEIMN